MKETRKMRRGYGWWVVSFGALGQFDALACMTEYAQARPTMSTSSAVQRSNPCLDLVAAPMREHNMEDQKRNLHSTFWVSNRIGGSPSQKSCTNSVLREQWGQEPRFGPENGSLSLIPTAGGEAETCRAEEVEGTWDLGEALARQVKRRDSRPVAMLTALQITES
ncbi:hypothetical protein V8F20_008383 [Naviculisporaceae sp. PSN 640]